MLESDKPIEMTSLSKEPRGFVTRVNLIVKLHATPAISTSSATGRPEANVLLQQSHKAIEVDQ